MLGSSNYSGDDNKKKYLILGIILVVLFLLTIIIIRLLTDDPSTKEDQFTSNGAASSEMKKTAENENIEENFQKIINERVKKDANEPMVPETKTSATTNSTTQSNSKTKHNETKNTETIKDDGNASPAFESLQKEAENYKPSSGISDEAMEQTIKKVEKSKSLPKEKAVPTQKQEVVTKEDTTIKKVETKKSIKDLVDSAPYSAPTKNSTVSTTSTSRTISEPTSDSSSISGGYFIQVGAFTKAPTDSYVANIRNAKLKYKVHQENVNGTTYNKVLIGPYSSKATASQSVEDVKQKLNVTSAFVVKF